MNHFADREGRFTLSTNPKCMYLTIQAQPTLRPVGEPLDGVPHYMVVRDPYRRLLSFWRDKFEVNLPVYQRIGQYPHHYQVFFRPFGVSERGPVEMAQAALASLTFAGMVDVLADVFMLDHHLWPQTTGLVPVDRFLQMRSKADMRFLETLGLNLAVHRNPTGPVREDDYYTPRLRTVVRHLYLDDFQQLGYQDRLEAAA